MSAPDLPSLSRAGFRHSSNLRRITAALSIALVLLLTVFAASPELHAWLHGPAPTTQTTGHGHEPIGTADHQCAVTLFAHGTTAPPIFCWLVLVRCLICERSLPAGDWRPGARVRYWLAPSHAPPA